MDSKVTDRETEYHGAPHLYGHRHPRTMSVARSLVEESGLVQGSKGGLPFQQRNFTKVVDRIIWKDTRIRVKA